MEVKIPGKYKAYFGDTDNTHTNNMQKDTIIYIHLDINQHRQTVS